MNWFKSFEHWEGGDHGMAGAPGMAKGVPGMSVDPNTGRGAQECQWIPTLAVGPGMAGVPGMAEWQGVPGRAGMAERQGGQKWQGSSGLAGGPRNGR